MKVIRFEEKYEKTIHFRKIKPFKNICRVTGVSEDCNVEVVYTPDEHVIEIGSYREFFEKEFNMYIEELAEHVFETIKKLANPKYLKVTIYLEDKGLTPWEVTIES